MHTHLKLEMALQSTSASCLALPSNHRLLQPQSSKAEVKNLVAIHRQGYQSRIFFLIFTFRSLTVSPRPNYILIHMPRMFTNVDHATMGSSSPSALGHTIPEVSKLLRYSYPRFGVKATSGDPPLLTGRRTNIRIYDRICWGTI